MKLFISFLWILLVPSTPVKCQDSVCKKIESINLRKYLGGPIDSFIANLPVGYDHMEVTSIGCKMFVPGGVSLSYSTLDIYIEIAAFDFKYIDRHKLNRMKFRKEWPLDLMRKEKIYSIEITDGDSNVLKYACIEENEFL